MNPDLYSRHTRGGLWLPNRKPIYSPHLYVDDERCVGCWLFNEAGGNIAHDISGSGNNGVLTSGPTWAGGNFGGAALDCDTNDNYVVVDDNVELQLTNTGTVCIWVYPRNVTSAESVVGKGNVYNDNLCYGFTYYLTNIYGTIDDGGVTTQTTIAAEEDRWIHYCLAWDGNDLNLYKDGVLADSTAQSCDADTTGEPLVVSGNSAAGSPVRSSDQQVDEVRIYNEGLTASEISELYHNPFHDIKELRPMVFGFSGGASFTETPSDTLSLADAAVLSVSKEIADTITLAEATEKLVTTILADTITLADAPALFAQIVIADAVSLADAVVKSISNIVLDTVSLADTAQISASLQVADAVSIAESILKGVQLALADSTSISEATAIALAHIEADGIVITESVVSGIAGQITESVAEVIVLSESVVTVKISGVASKTRKPPIERDNEVIEWQEIIDIEREI